MTVAAALLVDYVMTVAVSVSAGVDNLISAAPGLANHRVGMALWFVLLLTAANLRGLKESGKAFAVPTYGFVLGIFTMFAFAIIKSFTALTGVEAVANGVPASKKPKSTNAAATLLLMGALAMSMFIGITLLALMSHVHVVEHTCQLVGLSGCDTYTQKTVIAQVSAAVFGASSPLYLQAATAGILILAANTAFNGFPLLGSILAKDSFLPRQLQSRGDRLVYSNGIMLPAAVGGTLIYAYPLSTSSGGGGSRSSTTSPRCGSRAAFFLNQVSWLQACPTSCGRLSA